MVSETIDLDVLRASFRDVLAVESPLDGVLRLVRAGGGVDDRLWQAIASLGWLGLSVPEHLGGLGLGLDALAVLYEELGRVVAPVPVLPTLLAAQVLVRDGNDAQQARWLLPVVEGTVRGAVSSPADFEPVMVQVTETDGALHLSGSARNILDGADADLLLILARRTNGGLARIAIKPAGDAVAVSGEALWDKTHGLAHVALSGVTLPADRLIPVDAASEELLARHASLALAADGAGGSAACLGITVDYLKTRQQFGKVIGSFQALKHRVANFQVGVIADTELVRSAAALAVLDDPVAAAEISAAKAHVCRDYADLARDAIQLHGGIGFTAEHVCHLFLMRARLNEALFGGAGYHLDRVLDHLLESSAA